MRIADFIVVYNETFKYIYEKDGPHYVKALWRAISENYCKHLDKLIREKGLDGMLEYWGGALEEEKADYTVKIENDVFCMDMHACPSIAELKSRNREIFGGELNYCMHCPHLYPPVARKHGYEMNYNIEYDENGNCTGRCHMRAWKRDV
ncbi:MAG TPA: hypothetical protein GXX20_08495 [Clostridiaceae bacterium]|nr:hypothetical protein [Clostridiaceae bacterium]